MTPAACPFKTLTVALLMTSSLACSNQETETPMVSEPPPATWLQAQGLATHPLARSVAGMVYDSDRQVSWLVAGQADGPLPVGDLWQWDGSSWHYIDTPTALPLRKNFGIAYDRARRRLVVVGGIVGGLAATPVFLNDTWEFDGHDWQQVNTAHAPTPRSGHALTYDIERQRTILFAGGNNDTVTNETWEYDGVDWHQLEIDAPPARYNSKMVYDSTRKRALLFGGQDGDSYADLWSFDGTRWHDLTPAGQSPEPRGFFAMAYDAARDRVVVQGGTRTYPPFITEDNSFADQWEFDGATWQLVTTDSPPGIRCGQAMIYDEAREALVLFGGAKGNDLALDDTWVFSRCIPEASSCYGERRMHCSENGWILAENCSDSAKHCVMTNGQAQCQAASACVTHTPYQALTRYDNDLFNRYLVLSNGIADEGALEAVQMVHTRTPTGSQSLVDPRTAAETPTLRLFGIRGSTIFAAVSGTVNLVALEEREMGVYVAEVEAVQFVEAVPADEGFTYPEDGEELCVDHLRLASIVVRYFCSDWNDALQPGDLSCAEQGQRSVVVRCDEGYVHTSGGNAGRLVVVDACTDAARVCVNDPDDGPVCRAPGT